MKVQQVAYEQLQGIDVETNKDEIVKVAFQLFVEERSRYHRGLGVGIQPTKGQSIIGLCEQLTNECEKRQTLEIKLKKNVT